MESSSRGDAPPERQKKRDVSGGPSRPSRREFLQTAAVGATAGFGLAGCGVGQPPAPGKTVSLTVVKRSAVTAGAALHRAFPSLTRLRDGTLLVVYREGSDHWRTDDSVLRATRSSDNGATWSEPETIFREPGWAAGAHHGPLQLADSRILVPAQCIRHVEKGQLRNLEFRVFNLRSDDGGRTWKRREIGPQTGWSWQNQYGRLKEIDGKLWQGGGGQREGEDYWRTGYFVSYDDGESWPEWHTIATHLQDERDILELGDGRLLSMIRSGNETYRSYSADRGKSWSPAEKLDLFGQCPSLLTLPSGHILFAYRQVRPGAPVGVGAAVSGDGGATWTETDPIYVSPDNSRDCAYPSMIPDGEHVLAAYYTTFRDGNSHIELARLRVETGV